MSIHCAKVTSDVNKIGHVSRGRYQYKWLMAKVDLSAEHMHLCDTDDGRNAGRKVTSLASLSARTQGSKHQKIIRQRPWCDTCMHPIQHCIVAPGEWVAESISLRKTNFKVTDQISSESTLPKPICLVESLAGRLTIHRDHAKLPHPTQNAGWKSISHRCCTTYWKLIPAETTTGTMCAGGTQYSTTGVPSTQALFGHWLSRFSLTVHSEEATGCGYSPITSSMCSKKGIFRSGRNTEGRKLFSWGTNSSNDQDYIGAQIHWFIFNTSAGGRSASLDKTMLLEWK